MVTGQSDKNENSNIVYGLDDRPPLREAIPMGVQHVMFMIVINLSLAIVIAGGIGLTVGAGQAYIIQMALLVAGIGTIVQCYPFGGKFGFPVGAKMPIVMGTSASFITPLIIIAEEFGLAVMFTSIILAAPVEIVVGYHFDKFRKVFPPLLGGIVVTLIGLSLAPVAIDYFAGAAGGPGEPGYGSLTNLGLGTLVLIIALFFNQFFSGVMRAASVLIGLAVGYAVAIPLGMVDFSPVAEASWVAFPELMPYGFEVNPTAILTLVFIYIIVAVETIGDVNGVAQAADRNPTDEEVKGGLIADGVLSALAGIVGMFPNTSFSGNVGMVSYTGVLSRFVVGIGGGFLILMGLSPKVGAVFSVTPTAVLGGATIVLFGMILALGIRIIVNNVSLDLRNMIVVGTSLLVGLGVEIKPEVIGQLPKDVQVIFGSALAAGTATGIVLNLALPEEPPFNVSTIISDRETVSETVESDD
jgi:xanthine permease